MGKRTAKLAFVIPLAFTLGLFMWKKTDFLTSTGKEVVASKHIEGVSQESTTTPSSSTIVGLPTIIDGDTLDVKGNRIRLNGIDAPESSQTCKMSGETYRCGLQAKAFLRKLIGLGEVNCNPLNKDRYGRTVATCLIDERDIGMTMVANGWALAYREYDLVYVAQENEASNAGLGMWAGAFVEPWLWRKGQRLEGE